MIIVFMNHPGSDIFINVSRCIRSLYDSSRSVSIQPLSRLRRRRLSRCRSMPATIPGTPAIDSRNMKRTSCEDLLACVRPGLRRRCPCYCAYPLSFSQRLLGSRGCCWVLLVDLLLRSYTGCNICCPSSFFVLSVRLRGARQT